METFLYFIINQLLMKLFYHMAKYFVNFRE